VRWALVAEHECVVEVGDLDARAPVRRRPAKQELPAATDLGGGREAAGGWSGGGWWVEWRRPGGGGWSAA